MTATASAAEAITALDREVPDLLVSDIGMPGLDGYELLGNVRRRSEKQGGRVAALALTGYADPGDAQKAVAAGFQMHLAKPVSLPDLLRGLAQLAGRLDAN